jgi:hypothetical protein
MRPRSVEFAARMLGGLLRSDQRVKGTGVCAEVRTW